MRPFFKHSHLLSPSFSYRDTLFSASTAKRFQLLKIGLTSKLKSSTTNIEKVAGTSLKNGFARMLQGWKQAGEPSPHAVGIDAILPLKGPDKTTFVKAFRIDLHCFVRTRRKSLHRGIFFLL